MPLNLELKVKLKDFKKIKNLLTGINSEYIKELNQKDVYYKIPGKLLKLRIENGEESIIKYDRNEKGENRFSDYEVLYFKNPIGLNFFKGIFDVEAVVQKRRQLYMFDNTRIHLDVVKNLGKFLELETLVINGKQDAQKRFDFIVKQLQLDFTNQIRKSYRDLIKEVQKKE